MKVYTGQTRSARAIALCSELGLGECVNRGELPPRRLAAGWFYAKCSITRSGGVAALRHRGEHHGLMLRITRGLPEMIRVLSQNVTALALWLHDDIAPQALYEEVLDRQSSAPSPPSAG